MFGRVGLDAGGSGDDTEVAKRTCRQALTPTGQAARFVPFTFWLPPFDANVLAEQAGRDLGWDCLSA